MREINFDGIVGPTHNYAGLSFGNLASAANAGQVSSPRAAALQGLAKMRRLIELGLTQGILPPDARPDAAWLRRFGFTGDDAEVCAAAWREAPALLRDAASASAMWTANAATVSPAADTRDGRCHLTVANLATMLHRSVEPRETERQLRLVFADERYFAVHSPLPAGLGDEGAANAMRLAARHGDPGIEIFVHGAPGGRFPSRQHRLASEAVARRHGLDPQRTCFVEQSPAAIEAGAFHNDVVAVANEGLLFAHEDAFSDRERLHAFIRAQLPAAQLLEVPRDRVSLQDAIASYLFNAQLVTLAEGGMALILPQDARDNAAVWAWLSEQIDGDGPIRRLEVIDLRESMRNGGGPACLRLRVAVDEAALAAIDARFLVDRRKLDALGAVIEAQWPDRIAPADLGDPALWAQARSARTALLDALDLAELGSNHGG